MNRKPQRRTGRVLPDAQRLTPGTRRPTFFFDLDNTLHDASHAIFGQINVRMTAY
ncbi:MAG: HAD family hydrolase, partial [Betaproteobacteria bacterium]